MLGTNDVSSSNEFKQNKGFSATSRVMSVTTADGTVPQNFLNSSPPKKSSMYTQGKCYSIVSSNCCNLVVYIAPQLYLNILKMHNDDTDTVWKNVSLRSRSK